MNRYQPKSFRPVYGFASAAAMTALTLAMSVVVPAGLATACGPEFVLANAAPTNTQVVTLERMDVVVSRQAHVAEAPVAPRG
jgi:hypothetical protein